jgi:hypothetical protein
MKSKKSKQKRGNPGTSNGQRFGPPQLDSNIIVNHKFRFTASSSGAYAISQANLIGICGMMGSTTNAAVASIIDCFKVNSVEIWGPPASQGSFSTVSVEWIGGTTTLPSLTKEVSDTTCSVAEPAHVFSRPPKTSTVGFWNSADGGGSNIFFTVSVPAGSIIDVNVSFILGDNSQHFTVAVSTAVVGEAYYLSLDGPASNLLVPVSMNTTH